MLTARGLREGDRRIRIASREHRPRTSGLHRVDDHLVRRRQHLLLRREIAATTRERVRDETQEHSKPRTDEHSRENEREVRLRREQEQKQTEEQAEPDTAQRARQCRTAVAQAPPDPLHRLQVVADDRKTLHGELRLRETVHDALGFRVRVVAAEHVPSRHAQRRGTATAERTLVAHQTIVTGRR